MKARADSVTVTITRDEGVKLQNQILEHMGGNMKLHTELAGTPIANLFDLLNGNFDRATRGINYTD